MAYKENAVYEPFYPLSDLMQCEVGVKRINVTPVAYGHKVCSVDIEDLFGFDFDMRIVDSYKRSDKVYALLKVVGPIHFLVMSDITTKTMMLAVIDRHQWDIDRDTARGDYTTHALFSYSRMFSMSRVDVISEMQKRGVLDLFFYTWEGSDGTCSSAYGKWTRIDKPNEFLGKYMLKKEAGSGGPEFIHIIKELLPEAFAGGENAVAGTE